MKQHVIQFFKFLEKKENRKVPLEVKLLNPKDFKIDPEDLDVKGDLKLRNTPIESLPDNLTVRGNLDLEGTSIQSLPDNLAVRGNLHLHDTPIEFLPDNLTVRGDLDLSYTRIQSLPDNLTVRGHLFLSNTPLVEKYTEEEIESMIEEKGVYVNKEVFFDDYY